MDFSQDKPIRELAGIQQDNSDISLEDIRAILAEEITVEDIYRRRREKLEAETFEADVLARMIELADTQTKKLLYIFRKQKGSWGSHHDYEYYSDRLPGFQKALVEHTAIKRVLDTREHVPTKNKLEGKAERRRLSQQHHGGKKNRTR
jgi:hypothetical protein